jgi:hypothetical protein
VIDAAGGRASWLSRLFAPQVLDMVKRFRHVVDARDVRCRLSMSCPVLCDRDDGCAVAAAW